MAEHTLFPTNSRSRTVWRGDHPSLPDWVKGLRLLGIAVDNPKPKVPVQTVDLISTESRATWVVLSLTAGPSGSLKADPKLEQDEPPPAEEITMQVTALDQDTGRPVAEARFEIILLAGRRPRPYGIYTADNQGHALIELPPEHIKLLSIQATHDGYAPEEMTWNVQQGSQIPTNYVFRIAKE